jgi:hypothetical protein
MSTTMTDDRVTAFNDAVSAKMAGGMSRGRAIERVVVEQPDLHGDYLNAVNGRGPAHVNPAAVATEFHNAIAAKRAAGMSGAQADAALERENPRLYRAFATTNSSPHHPTGAASPPGRPPTVPPPAPGGDADPIAAFNAAVKIKVAAGMSKRDATTAVVDSDPDLHRAYVHAVNVRSR